MSELRGTYSPVAIIALEHASGVQLVQPMLDKDDGRADAIYRFQERRGSSGKWIYRLHHIEEWLPPRSPRERAALFTDEARLPPITEDGRIDWKAYAERRNREWREAEEMGLVK